jgi:hypothetical protein
VVTDGANSERKMTKDEFDQTLRVLADGGIAIESAQYDPETFGSWVISVAATPHLRIVWDGRESMLIVQRKTSEFFNGFPVWQDLWMVTDSAKQTPENAVEAIRANTTNCLTPQ